MKFSITKNLHNLKYSGSFLRILTYLVLALSYLFFLHFRAPLGIGWREWHEIRVINALTNILDNFVFLKYGITSWHDYSSNYLDITNGKKSIYLIGAFNYLHYLPFAYFGGIQFFKSIGPIIDNSLIAFTSILVAEINIILFNNRTKINPFFVGITTFSLFLTSPWVYRMIVAQSQEVYYFLFLFASILFYFKNYKKTAFFLYAFGGFYQYQWAFFVTFSIATISIAERIYGSSANIKSYLLPHMNKLTDFYKLILVGIIPTAVSLLQNFLVTNSEYNFILSNTSPLSRIGIDSADNVYHGGWLSALQFLGGNRITLCLKNPEFFTKDNQLSEIILNFFSFNCVISVFGMIILSLISITGFIYFYKNLGSSFKWLLYPLALSIILFIAIFQQTWSAHLQGYSYPFAFIFSMGLFSAYNFLIQKIQISKFISTIGLLPTLIAIITSNIRVIYITGVMG